MSLLLAKQTTLRARGLKDSSLPHTSCLRLCHLGRGQDGAVVAKSPIQPKAGGQLGGDPALTQLFDVPEAPPM